MNICMSISQLYAPQGGTIAGGNINAMLALTDALGRRGHSMTVLSGWPHRHSAEEVRAQFPQTRLELLRLHRAGPLVRNVELLFQLARTAYKWRHKVQFEMIHGHSGYPHLSAMTVLLKKVLGVPAVHTVYCPMTNRLNDRKAPMLRAMVPVRSLLGRMDRIIAVSENVRRSLEDLNLPEEKVVMIGPAIRNWRNVSDEEVLAFRHKLGTSPEDRVVLFVGNFTRAKGFDLVIKALAKVKQELEQVKLVYAIERGPKFSNEREKEVRSLLRDHTDLADTIELGIVPDMPLLMASSDVFVLPFRETSGPMDYPMTLLEAMASGAAVIAARVGGISEVIQEGETGMLIDPDDEDSLARAMLTLLRDETLRLRLGQRAKLVALDRFNQEKVAQKTEEIYDQVLHPISKDGG